jgi:hypothetical protein
MVKFLVKSLTVQAVAEENCDSIEKQEFTNVQATWMMMNLKIVIKHMV